MSEQSEWTTATTLLATGLRQAESLPVGRARMAALSGARQVLVWLLEKVEATIEEEDL